MGDKKEPKNLNIQDFHKWLWSSPDKLAKILRGMTKMTSEDVRSARKNGTNWGKRKR